MTDSYLKYIETTDMIDEGPTAGLTRLQHVGVVAVYDENGNEWFPPEPVPEYEELTVVTESVFSESNEYKWGNTIEVTSATFAGGLEPYEIWGRYRWRLNGTGGFEDGTRLTPENEPTTYSMTVPDNSAEITFFTAVTDAEPKDAPVGPMGYINSTIIPTAKVLQLDPRLTLLTPEPVTANQGLRVNLRVQTEVNYQRAYTWQFEDPSGQFRNAAEANINKYYPDATYTLITGTQSDQFSFIWFAGGAGPPTFRGRLRDEYKDEFEQEFTNEINITYPDATAFAEREFDLVEEPTFSKTEGPFSKGDVLSVDSFGVMTLPFHTLTYYWFACPNDTDASDLSNYRNRGSNGPYDVSEFDVADGYNTWRLMVLYETDETDDEGLPKEYSHFSEPITFE